MIALIAAVMLHWLVLNDIHLNPYDSGPPAMRGEDTNAALFDASVREMVKRVPNASVIVISGDLLAHHFPTLAHSAHQEPYAAAVSTIRAIASKLNAAFPKAQFLIAVGNNDDPCGDYRSEAEGTYNAAVARVFAPLVDRHGSSPGFIADYTRGAYYTAALPNGLRGVVTNSVFWSFFYRGSCQVNVRDPGAKEMQWLAQTLSSGHNVVVMHMPPGYDPESTTDAHRLLPIPFLRSHFDDELRGLLDQDRSNVPFAIAGHTHRYDFRLPSGVPMLIASSLSPVYDNEPAFFRVDIDGETVHDVMPYSYDSDLGWIPQQSFDRMFGVNAFTAPELYQLSRRIAGDPDLRARWEQAYDGWGYSMNDVTTHRWQTYRCAQVAFGEAYARCAGTYVRSATNLVVLAALLIIVVVAAAVLIVTWKRPTPSL
ncbi:MAG: metallophosphoesterase [Candidatus Eremiobacteraeota bacterium]|nr:metallophosphoesterase [Candidatus Eremiobacteraeota bacterium]